jgi:hypothetical protein
MACLGLDVNLHLDLLVCVGLGIDMVRDFRSFFVFDYLNHLIDGLRLPYPDRSVRCCFDFRRSIEPE